MRNTYSFQQFETTVFVIIRSKKKCWKQSLPVTRFSAWRHYVENNDNSQLGSIRWYAMTQAVNSSLT